MKLFITATFNGEKNREEIEKLCNIVKQSGFEDFSFIRDIEKYQKKFTDPAELMSKAKQEIERSDALLIDVTNKPTGRAIEAGIAYALGKPIIMVAKRGTTIKDTSRGIADLLIKYDDIEDIILPLKHYLNSI